LQTAYLFYCIGYTELKRFNDIVTNVTITAVIVFLAVIALISLFMITSLLRSAQAVCVLI